MFVAGAIISGVTYLLVFTKPITAESFTYGFPIILGFVLMGIAGIKGLKKFNNYLDK